MIAKGLIVHDAFVCAVYLDGKHDRLLRLRDVKVKDIRMMEVYSANGCAEDVPGKPGIRVIRPLGRPCYTVYIWLKH